MQIVNIQGTSFAVYGPNDELPPRTPRGLPDKSATRIAIEALNVGDSVAVQLTERVRERTVRSTASNVHQSLGRKFTAYLTEDRSAVVVTRQPDEETS